MLRVIYLGTPMFAVIPLQALAGDSRYEVVGVITQPDRPARRSGTPEPPAVKQAALALGIPVLQPETLRDEAAIEALADMRPDVGVVAAYGEILRKRVLEIPPHGYINLHPSLLPRWRGPTPVAGAILAGDVETGVTLIKLDAKMDSGPILVQHREALDPVARAGQLTDDLFHVGSRLLLESLEAYAAGNLVLTPQHDSEATYTRLLSRADGEIDWTQPAVQIERMVRAYDPWPGAFTTFRSQPFRVLTARTMPDWHGDAMPGMVLNSGESVGVATGRGALELVVVQPAGKRPMSALDWQRGLRGAELRLGRAD